MATAGPAAIMPIETRSPHRSAMTPISRGATAHPMLPVAEMSEYIDAPPCGKRSPALAIKAGPSPAMPSMNRPKQLIALHFLAEEFLCGRGSASRETAMFRLATHVRYLADLGL